jgi:hypothetical protein
MGEKVPVCLNADAFLQVLISKQINGRSVHETNAALKPIVYINKTLQIFLSSAWCMDGRIDKFLIFLPGALEMTMW